MWQTYELLLEILIMRTLRITVFETSVLCGSLNYAAKSNILIALLTRNSENSKGIAALREAQSAAERNDFVHSFLTHGVNLHLVRREVKNGKYKVDLRTVSKGSMQTLACTRFRRHRVRCFDGTGGESWRDESLRANSSLRLCG